MEHRAEPSPPSPRASTLNFEDAQPRGQTRGRFEKAAVDLFCEKGFMATTVRDLTIAVGLSPGSLYHHFESKEALLHSIIRATADELERRLVEARSVAGGSPTEAVRAHVETFVRFYARFPKECRVSNRDFVFLPQPWLDEVYEVRRRGRRALEDLLEEGVASGEFTLAASGPMPATRSTAMAILDMCSLVYEPYWLRRLTPDHLAKLHADLALRLVGIES